jgi:outer membrane lipoprotein LolB
LVLALVATLATGCSTVPERPPAADARAAWQTRQSRLAPLMSWQIQGRLSARTQDKGWQAAVRWVRNDGRHEIDLWGPLGRGHVRIIQNSNGAELVDSEQHSYRAANAQDLLFDTTGWWLPIDGLNYWVLGLPVPRAPAEQVLDAWGRLKHLQQLGWNIDFLQYRQEGAYELPTSLALRRPADAADAVPPDSTMRVRVLIDHWSVTR